MTKSEKAEDGITKTKEDRKEDRREEIREEEQFNNQNCKDQNNNEGRLRD